ncbi:hypothetical protein IB233_03300 [Comamonas sp. CMM01]|uniref:hypothetical protein n=1 Tax=Comamonas sp. CMM01 TaxID=2769280 RepID=UPI0017812365|nr:hypothetical protein [Comamonas sp. CMM01]MBD9530660.1 hypothetical protein [Comamonas sp. CMM01]
MKKRLSQLDKEKAALLAKVSTTARKNSDARKYALGGALLKIAATDAKAHEVLRKAWAMGQKDKPRAFDDACIPTASNEKPPIKPSVENQKVGHE